MGSVMRAMYLVKYALSQGIREVVVEDDGTPLVTWKPSEWVYPIYLQKEKDVFHTREEAISRAEEMAEKAIASSEKKLKKLRELAEEPKWYEEKEK